MIRIYLFSLIYILTANFCQSQTLKIFKGSVDYKFNCSSTHKLKPDERAELEQNISVFLPRMELLTEYYNALNRGDTYKVNQIKKQDTIFADDNSFGLALMFTLTRMKQLGILYQPCIQVNDLKEEASLIVCSEKQYEIFVENANEKIYALKCEYVGDMIIDNFKVYRITTFR